MLYKIFNSLKEAHGQDYNISKDDKKLNQKFYGG